MLSYLKFPLDEFIAKEYLHFREFEMNNKEG